MTEYVLGFAFCQDSGNDYVLLIKKARPANQAGKLNGIGGRVETEHGETALSAMDREFREETGIAIDQTAWTHFATLEHPGPRPSRVYCYLLRLPFSVLYQGKSPDPTEPVALLDLADLPRADVMANLYYLIPLALDNTVMPVTFTYR